MNQSLRSVNGNFTDWFKPESHGLPSPEGMNCAGRGMESQRKIMAAPRKQRTPGETNTMSTAMASENTFNCSERQLTHL